MVDERTILQGLVQRGLPPHIAQGFVMNMRDESGLNPGINEIAPLVPGSRGGFGLYQLTGPRRTAYEQFAGSRGVDPANVDAQLDFLVSELQGPESRAARSIFSAQDAPSAAVAIARDFLRPAPENLQRRVAQYTGGTTMQPQGLLSAPTTPAQGQEPQRQPFFQRPETQDLLDRLAIGFSNLSMRPNQGIVQMAQSRMEQRQTSQQRNATADWLESQGLGAFADGVRQGAISASDALTMSRGPEATAAQRNYEFLLAQNVPQDEALQRAFSGGTTINMPGAPTIGTIPPGYQAVQDPQTGRFTFEPIEGGPVAAEQIAAQEREVGRSAQRARAGSTVVQDLQRALDLLPQLGALAEQEGVVGGVTRTAQAALPGTVANRITQFTESALSNVGLDTLQQMRENSPTGGALGQVPIQQQTRLEQVLGSLKIDQPPSVLDANIKRVINIYTDIIHGSPEERALAVQRGTMTPEESAEIDQLYYQLPFDERGRLIDGSSGGDMSDEELLRMYGGQ